MSYSIPQEWVEEIPNSEPRCKVCRETVSWCVCDEKAERVRKDAKRKTEYRRGEHPNSRKVLKNQHE